MATLGDAERIVIYPRRSRLLGYALLYMVCALVALLPFIGFGSAALPPYSLTHPVQAALGVCVAAVLGLFIGLLVVVLLSTLYRIVVRAPSIMVTEEGIVDGCSLIAGGMGLLRWAEIADIWPYAWSKQAIYLVVTPLDPSAVLARRGPLARLFLRAITLPLPGRIGMPQWLLSTTVDQLWPQVHQRYRATFPAHGSPVPPDDPPEAE